MNITFNTAAPPATGPQETAQPRSAPAPAPTMAHAAQTAPASAETIKQAARQINDLLKSSQADVEFTVNSESNHVVVRIVDSQTQQVIRQMPSEEMIAIAKSMDRMSGLLIQQKV